MLYSLSLLILFTLSYCSNSDSQTVLSKHNVNYTKRYNLDFNNFQDSVTTWRKFFCRSNTKIDTSIIYNGKHPFKIYPFKMNISNHLDYNVSQQILLPDAKFNTIEVCLTSKMKNITRAKLWIDHISEYEKIMFTDTVDINSTDAQWHTFSHTFSSKGVKYLGLRFFISSKSEQEKMAWLDKIQIFLDKKPIDSFPLQDAPLFALKESAGVVELSLEENKYSLIPEFANKKIMALGETTHGSASINKVVTQIVRHQIESNNCRLVLLELPFELMLSVDKYVKGDTSFAGDSLIKSYRPYYDKEALDALIHYITEYNIQHVDDPVTLMGMDISLSMENTYEYLLHYVKCMNLKKKDIVLNDFCDILSYKSTLNFSSEVLTYVENHPELKQLIPSSDYNAIVQSLKISEMMPPVFEIRADFRDLVMKQNTTFLLNEYAPEDKRVIIYTHFNHANYGTINYSIVKPTMGTYMKDEYKEAYGCLGILLGNGNVLALTMEEPECLRKIFSPKKNSMEFCFDVLPESFFYCPSTDFEDMPSYIRLLGVPYMEKEQFYLINPKARMDGAIFIKESEAVVLEKK